ncbi:50S ribosomal protein L33 [Limosilactobacillus equigenerosi]|nr:50S ribosomal protein L33 [Limosilactobacillus equigenerosi]MCQ2569721.1 50S ribosomal protein L33 [Limosilactobacillus sp.]
MGKQKEPLACSVCGRRNYSVPISGKPDQRLTLNKFCKQCGRVTVHQQTR